MVILAAAGEKHDPDRIIAQANELANAYETELQVVHVIPEDEADDHFEELRKLPGFGDVSYDTEIDRARQVARRLIELGVDDDEAHRITPIGRIGDPTDEILSLAEEVNPEYLVIGGRKRSPTGKALFGSVTQSVILNAERPVVTVMAES